MRHRLPLFVLVACLGGLAGQRLAGQQSGAGDEEKRRQFLRAREEMYTVPATPAPAPTPAPKPKPRASPAPEATPAPRPVTPAPAPVRPATPRLTPEPPRLRKPEVTPRPREVTPPPLPRVTPAPVTPLPAVTPAPVQAPVTIEKSGYEETKGLQPVTASGWFTKYKYLTKSVRAEIDRAPVKSGHWRYIVVHNSGTRQGNAKAFDYYHLHVRKMVNGLAYHFVIGNGSSSGDGEIEIGNRWRKQLQGGHVHSDYLNNIALGICLVGDFNRDLPSQQQLASLDELIRYLRNRVGRIDRQWAIVKPHRDINPPRWPTDCPGDRFPFAWLHRYD